MSKKINTKKQLIHSNSNLVLIDHKSNNTINLSFNKDTNYYLLNLANDNTNITINFMIKNRVKLNFYLLSINKNGVHNYHINLQQSNSSDVEMQAKLFANNNAKIKIDCNIQLDQKAIKTNANQIINGFLFSNNSSIEACPALLVDTNHTKASHAVNIGYLSKDKLFYLFTKGIDKVNAINLLIMNEISFLNNLKDSKLDLNTLVFNKIKGMIKVNE